MNAQDYDLGESLNETPDEYTIRESLRYLKNRGIEVDCSVVRLGSSIWFWKYKGVEYSHVSTEHLAIISAMIYIAHNPGKFRL